MNKTNRIFCSKKIKKEGYNTAVFLDKEEIRACVCDSYDEDRMMTDFSLKDSKESEREHHNIVPTMNMDEESIMYDFNNSERFVGTIPLCCEISGHVIRGKNWNQIFVGVIEFELQNNKSRLKALYNEPLTSKKGNRPFFLKEKIAGLHCSELSNGYWVNANWNTPKMLDLIGAFCLYCGYRKEQVVMCGVSKKVARNATKLVKKETPGIQSIPGSLLKAICQYYPNGLRFDDTVLQLLKEYSGCEVDKKMQNELQKVMFKRRDGLYFLPEMIINSKQEVQLQIDIISGMIDKYGCIVANALYKNYIASGDNMLLRDEDDFKDYLLFLMPNDIRIVNKLNSNVIKKTGEPFDVMAQNAAQMVVKTIKENECITQEDILGTYPVFSETFLRKLLEKYTDEIVVTKINDCLCYQTIESLGIDSDFSLSLDAVLGEIERFSLMPSQDIIHALLSVKLGYNICEELGIPDDKTFRRIISMYYVGERQRTWKAKCFVEADIDYV